MLGKKESSERFELGTAFLFFQAGLFAKNFVDYADMCPEAVVNAGPKDKDCI